MQSASIIILSCQRIFVLIIYLEGRKGKKGKKEKQEAGEPGDINMDMCKTHFRLVSGSVGVQDCVKSVWPREFKKDTTFLLVS